MKKKSIVMTGILVLWLGLGCENLVFAYNKGIYLTQSTAENRKQVDYLIQEAKATGLNTFVIDVNYKNARYAKNIAHITQNGIQYVARVVVFPDGGTSSQIKSRAYWEKRWQQASYAVSLGADAIQLDYIRYKASQPPSPQNARDIDEVVQFFDQKLQGSGVALQIDIFGVAAHKPSLAIGQNVVLFADNVNAICPMVYPSHYEPHPKPSLHPYQTVFNSVFALEKQLQNYSHVKIYAFVEANNYRHAMSKDLKEKYIQAQIQGVLDAGADGWYVWSPLNKYQVLFSALRHSKFNYKT